MSHPIDIQNAVAMLTAAGYKIEEPSREWEIVALKNKGHNGVLSASNIGSYDRVLRYINGEVGEEASWVIHSVNRLSDGVVFSVGDEVDWPHSSPFKITEFCIYKGAMFANEKSSCYGADIKYLNKYPPSNKQEPKEGFKWDDRLVKEFLKECLVSMPEQKMDKFKQSKSSSIESKERIEIVDCEFNLEEGWMKVLFKGDGEISATKYTAIKEAIEAILNDESDGFNKFYSQQQVDEFIKLAFNAARINIPVPPKFENEGCKSKPLYNTAQDYLKQSEK